MELTIQIPDDLARRLRAEGDDLSRRVVAALVIEEYRSGHLSKADLRRLPGLETRDALDGFLKAHRVPVEYTLEDLEQERRDLRRIGF